MAELSTLINNIPRADDGNVISSDYHNTIRDALVAIAAQLGPGVGVRPGAVTLIPNLLPMGPQLSAVQVPSWTVHLGFAADNGSGTGSVTNGWLPLSLPDGAVITKLVVVGTKASTAATASGSVSLLSQPITGTETALLIMVDLPASIPAGGGFQATTPTFQSPNTSVDNSKNKYMIQAQSFSSAADSIRITAFRVEYTTV
jgi:hypothetical protein